MSDIDSTTFPSIYPRLPPSNSASKHTTSSLLDNFLEISSESIIRRAGYNLRYSRNPTLSLASTNSSILGHHAQPFSSDSLSSPENIQFPDVDTAFSQRSSLSSYNQTGHLFSRRTSQSPSVFSSDEHLRNIDISTDQTSTPLTPNLVDYP